MLAFSRDFKSIRKLLRRGCSPLKQKVSLNVKVIFKVICQKKDLRNGASLKNQNYGKTENKIYIKAAKKIYNLEKV